ncbi:MAG TPA: ribosome maturation factor RimM [Gemmatimonadaceae bacterium]|nr:ribosome maturation factor RimM [Gemmatimonadaceae bacterium]
MSERVPPGDAGGARRPDEAFVIVGRIRKPQGLHGELLVEIITDDPADVFTPGRRIHVGTTTGDPSGDDSTLTVIRARPFKGSYIVGFAELDDRTSAEAWRGRYLLTPAGELPELAADEVYRHDLLGMRVTDDTAGEIGTVAELYDFPQGLTLEVRGPREPVLVPYRPEIVREVDLAERVIRVTLPPGFLD